MREAAARRGPGSETAPAARAAVPAVAAPTPAARLARQALEAGAGNRAVSRLLARAPKTEKEIEKEWAAQGPLGKKALELLKEHLPYEKLAELVRDKVAPLAQKAVEEAALQGMGVEKGKGAVTAVTSSGDLVTLAGKEPKWAEKAAGDWLKSAEGKAYLAKLQRETLEHPEIAYKAIQALVAGAIAGAAIAYFSGSVDPPLLSHKFQLGKHWSLTPGLDVGKWKSPLLQQGKLDIDWGFSKSGSMGLGAGLKLGETGGYALSTDYRLRWGPEKKPTFGLGVGYGYDWGTGAHSLIGGFQVQDFIKSSVKAVLSETGKDDKVSGELGGKFSGFDYKVAATWGLDEAKLKTLTLHAGFANEAQTLKFLSDLAYEHSDGAFTVKGNAALQVILNKVTLKLALEGGYGSMAGMYGRGILSAEVPVSKDFSILGSGALGYGAINAPGLSPGLMWSAGGTVKYKGTPILPQFWYNHTPGMPDSMGLGYDLAPLLFPGKKKK